MRTGFADRQENNIDRSGMSRRIFSCALLFFYGGYAMSSIIVKNLTFSYGGSGENVFSGASFTLDTDWKTGLTGRNGRGKTTLLRLLLGQYEYSGSVTADVRFSYFPPDFGSGGNAREVMERLCPDAEDWERECELRLIGFDPDKLALPFSALSEGERVKLEIAAMFLSDGGFPLIDEPTNHLDAEGRKSLSAYLAGKRGFIVASHDRDFLDGCADHIMSINRDGIEVRRGTFSAWLKDNAEREALERRKNESLTREISRLKESAARTTAWAGRAEAEKFGPDRASADRGFLGHKAAKMMKRAKVTEARRLKAAEEKSALLRGVEYEGEIALSPLPAPEHPVMLSGVSLSYGGREVCRGIDLVLGRGERVAVRGPNGCGKSTLLSLVCGECEADVRGNVFVAGGLKISRVRQTCAFRGTVAEFAENGGADPTKFFTVLSKLGVGGGIADRRMEELSDGQRKKAALALGISLPAHLYVWDEPLNYLDVISRMQLAAAIKSCAPTMLFVEHDESFVRDVATGTLEL